MTLSEAVAAYRASLELLNGREAAVKRKRRVTAWDAVALTSARVRHRLAERALCKAKEDGR